MKSFKHNMDTCPSEYALIVENVCPIILLPSPFADNVQMKEMHPHLWFHTADWLTHHLVVVHCQAMSQAFCELGQDPDVAVYEAISKKQKQNRQSQIKPCKQLDLPATHLSTSMQKAHKTRATNEVGVCFYIDFFHTNLLHQDRAVGSDPMDVCK